MKTFLPKSRTSGYDVMQHLIDHSEITNSQHRAIAVVIARHVSADLGYDWPSFDTIARKARCARTTVANAIASMEESGEWMVIRRKDITGKAPRATNMYFPLVWVGGANSVVPTKTLKAYSRSAMLDINADYLDTPEAPMDPFGQLEYARKKQQEEG